MIESDGIRIPERMRRPRKGESPTHLVCQCHREVLIPVRGGAGWHACVWTPVVEYEFKIRSRELKSQTDG